MPDDLLSTEIEESTVNYSPKLPDPPVTLAPEAAVTEAIELLQNAKRPLVIVGKGAAYGRAENNVLELIQLSGLPFLPTPMGKGVVSDTHPQLVATARTLCLQKADVVLLLGARLNWMLHFGKPPRFQPDVKIIQVDIEPEEFHQSIPTAVSLCGDINEISSQLVERLRDTKWRFEGREWWDQLKVKMEKNKNLVTVSSSIQ